DIAIGLCPSISGSKQQKGDVFLMNKDTSQYEACQLVTEEQEKYYQFDKAFLDLMHEAIEICPYFPYPYREIAAPYVKSGHFIQWKKYIDKAVQYGQLDYLPVRASLRYKFFADYEGAIRDIDLLDSLVNYDIGYTSNGTYHLYVVKALCLKAIGDTQAAIRLIDKQLETPNYSASLFDYLHLGVLYMELGDYDRALSLFEAQEEVNELADNFYYQALCHKAKGNQEAHQSNIKKAKAYYTEGLKMFDPYHELFDQVYLSQIDRELALISEKTD
ncbi:MAG: hypothetical protein AAFP19_16570, partial [Bacteroidota bacterium]